MSDPGASLTGRDLEAMIADVRSGRPGHVTRDINSRFIEAFRAHGGVVPGELSRVPLILVTVIGAKSGRARTVPLAYVEVEGRLFVIASTGGAKENPAWFNSIVANPRVEVEIRADTYRAIAVPLPDGERDRIFSIVSGQTPGFADYQSRTTRKIPVVEIRRET